MISALMFPHLTLPSSQGKHFNNANEIKLSGDLGRSHFNLIVHGKFLLFSSMSRSEFHVESNATNNQHKHTPIKTCDFSF